MPPVLFLMLTSLSFSEHETPSRNDVIGIMFKYFLKIAINVKIMNCLVGINTQIFNHQRLGPVYSG